MSLITKDEVAIIRAELMEEGFSIADANLAILTVLRQVAPDKLLDSYDIAVILENCSKRRQLLNDMFRFAERAAAIELQLPELWEQHLKMEAAKDEIKKLAEFLSMPVYAGDL